MAFKISKRFFNKRKQSKFKNKKVILPDGSKFDSIKEYERWLMLCILEKAGHILKLKRQVPFDLIPSYKGIQQKIKYIADFVYYENGKIIVEDAKGVRTDAYVIKRKLMYHIHKIILKEV